MSYDDKTRAQKPPETPVRPWDSGETVSPDPSLPVEDQLTWYRFASHVLLLNVSEPCRRQAAAAADKELQRAKQRRNLTANAIPRA